jgi:hypothetical protein
LRRETTRATENTTSRVRESESKAREILIEILFYCKDKLNFNLFKLSDFILISYLFCFKSPESVDCTFLNYSFSNLGEFTLFLYNFFLKEIISFYSCSGGLYDVLNMGSVPETGNGSQTGEQLKVNSKSGKKFSTNFSNLSRNDKFYINNFSNFYDSNSNNSSINKRMEGSSRTVCAWMSSTHTAARHGGFINCFYTNATSLGSKMQDLVTRLAQLGYPHLVFIAETWFSKVSACQLDGYELHQRDRESRGGGVCIYVRNDVNICSTEVVDQKLRSELIEQTWCGVKIGEDNILVGCIYRKPDSDSNLNREIIESIKAAKRLVTTGAYKSLVLAGDFNLPEINWN